MLKVGLTGGIGTGKSFILEIFRKEGVCTSEADALAKRIYQEDPFLRRELSSEFGPGLFKGYYPIKEKLEAILFDDPGKRKAFSQIFYPCFFKHQKLFFQSLQEQGIGMVIYESALLFEVGSFDLFDRIILASCPQSIQWERVRERGLKEEKIRKIIGSQGDPSEVVNHVHFVIHTGDEKERTRSETLHTLEELRKLLIQ